MKEKLKKNESQNGGKPEEQEVSPIPQTGSENGSDEAETSRDLLEEGLETESVKPVSQTGSENGPDEAEASMDTAEEGLETEAVKSVSQTDLENGSDEAGAFKDPPEDEPEIMAAKPSPQTGSENGLDDSVSSRGTAASDVLCQTGTDLAENTGDTADEDGAAAENTPFCQTDSENGSDEAEVARDLPEDEIKITAVKPSPQTDSEIEARKQGQDPSDREARGSSRQNPSDGEVRGSSRGADHNEFDLSPQSSSGRQIRNPSDRAARSNTRTTASILSIDERLGVETEADRNRNDLLDLLESQKTGRILTGTIQGVERQTGTQGRSLAVLYHGDYKIIIPADEAVEPPEDSRQPMGDALHYMITKRLGAEVDYIVKGIDPETGLAAASRLEAMRAKRKEYYLGTDRDGNFILYAGVCAEARVVSVIRAGIFVDLFGLELYVPLRELSYQRWMDAAGHFQPGQRILVKVLEVDRSDRNRISARVSVKQAGENPYEKALRRYSIGNRYVGTVSMVDTTGVFVALDGGIDCLCSYPKRGRPPRGSRVTVRILGIDHSSNRIWGAITHVAVPR